MEQTVLFRDFEERDIDFIYRCKNDEKLNSMTVGQFKPFTYEGASTWVRNCMKHDRPDLQFWAICTNDEEKRIVGWTSLSAIDETNSSACLHGTVIGDSAYRDGISMFETQLFCLNHCFNKLGLHRVYGSCLNDHPISPKILKSLGFVLEGERRDEIFKNGKYHNLLEFGMLKEEYIQLQESNSFEIKKLVRNFVKMIKRK